MIAKSFMKYIVFYVFLTYVIQFIFYYLGFYNDVWKTSENYFFLFSQLSIFFVLSFLFYYKNPISILFDAFYYLTRNIGKFIIKYKSIIIFSCFVLSIYFALNNLNAYRYSDQRLSDSINLPLLILAFFKSAIYAYIYIDFDLKKQNKNKNFLSLFQKTAIILLQLLSLTGLTSGLMLVFSIYLLIVYNPDKKNNFFLFFLKYLSVIFTFCILFIISYAVKWKVDFQESITIVKQLDVKIYIDYLISRLSGSYYALMNYANLNLNYTDYLENLSITHRNLIFRFDSLIGGILDVSKPAINSINRLNYTLINNEYIDDRSGASPGIIASFLYQFGSFFGIVLASAYSSYVFKLVDSVNKFSFLKLLVLIMFFQGIFKAPFQALLILDTNFLSLIIFIFYSKTVYSFNDLDIIEKGSKHLFQKT